MAKQLVVGNTTAPMYKREQVYLNLYLNGGLAGEVRCTLDPVRGITLQLSRDEQGNFSVEKVEEF